ncbi:MAG TPA: SRPBCC family protein [Polyangiaceae bacterium]|jgi:uncharacterized protein YndB with AHSA1/START domain
MSSTCISRHLNAPRARVYAALIDGAAVQKWRVPKGMQSEVHEFDGREGGKFRVSLTYDEPGASGKSSARTDTYHGHFVRLVPNELVLESLEFETTDPKFSGEMMITFSLSDEASGTRLDAVHDRVPAGVAAADNELGWSMSLANLAELVETK